MPSPVRDRWVIERVGLNEIYIQGVLVSVYACYVHVLSPMLLSIFQANLLLFWDLPDAV